MHLRRNKKKKNSVDYRNTLITYEKPKSPTSEAFRVVRTNIDFSSFDKEIETLLITSAQPAEGKSTIAANLCIAMAMVGKKILLIDADLRMPSLHKIFSIENNTGLTNLIINTGLAPCDVVLETGIQDLWLLTSGPIPPNPAELLASRRMRELMKELARNYDAAVVDSPPIMAVSDSSILASYLDGVIFVLGSGTVSRDAARTAKEQLNKVSANVLGVVLNKVPLNGSDYYYHNYYGRTD